MVARDFAQGATASLLGISAATSSAEALRTFLFYAGSRRQNIGVRSRDGRRGYAPEEGFVWASSCSSDVVRHLAKLLKKLCDLEPCETEPCLFAGTVLGNQRVVVLCYVDDLLITGESDEAIYHVVEQLKGAVKLKVTADLDRDGQITFLGRLLTRDHSSDSLYVTMSALSREGRPSSPHTALAGAICSHSSEFFTLELLNSALSCQRSTIVGAQKSLQFWRRQALGSQSCLRASNREYRAPWKSQEYMGERGY